MPEHEQQNPYEQGKKGKELQNQLNNEGNELTNIPSAVDPESLQGIPAAPGIATIEEHDTLPEISKDPR
ncbi:hypothetical protein F9B85_11060 [Heliorestis acidaminivorans]|uniref:Uncharacterized protein n=1 Tax=Heliorestis acidaminivorans TaxID=553427 RepID=A0A6I0ESH9_9FIRM|nr:hypothetical protein [Heliorestis acidaminivorans]KAB2951822.1 hypothetical protein F9B85_11060 [Heliorestis acidaminivorans]